MAWACLLVECQSPISWKAHGVSGFDSLVFYADDYEVTLNRNEMTGEPITRYASSGQTCQSTSGLKDLLLNEGYVGFSSERRVRV